MVEIVPGQTRKHQQTISRPATRSRRINIRASVEQESLIREAAERRGENLTDFMLRSACIEAESTLTDRRNFSLSPERWKAFLEVLDKAPVVKPQLQRLFSEPSILEKSR
jgi:uncharacterized protein (DUF1778 family)